MKLTTRFLLILFASGPLLKYATAQNSESTNPVPSNLATPQEKHLRNVRQLTFGEQNAEAYFSADGNN